LVVTFVTNKISVTRVFALNRTRVQFCSARYIQSVSLNLLGGAHTEGTGFQASISRSSVVNCLKLSAWN